MKRNGYVEKRLMAFGKLTAAAGVAVAGDVAGPAAGVALLPAAAAAACTGAGASFSASFSAAETARNGRRRADVCKQTHHRRSSAMQSWTGVQ